MPSSPPLPPLMPSRLVVFDAGLAALASELGTDAGNLPSRDYERVVALVAGLFGLVLLLICCACIVCWWCQRRRREKPPLAEVDESAVVPPFEMEHFEPDMGWKPAPPPPPDYGHLVDEEDSIDVKEEEKLIRTLSNARASAALSEPDEPTGAPPPPLDIERVKARAAQVNYIPSYLKHYARDLRSAAVK